MNTEIQLHEIYDVWYEPFWHKTWFYICVGIVLCGALYACARWIYHSWIGKKTVITPADRMKSAVITLRHKFHAHEIEPKDVYHGIMHELKVYLSSLFSLDLVDKTDYELLEVLKKTSYSPEDIHVLKRIVDNAVLVKFAQYDTVADQVSKDLDWCEGQVKKETPS